MSAVHLDITIPSDTAAGHEVQERIIGLMEEREFSMRDVFSVRLALEEALVNAIKHGNQLATDKNVVIFYLVTAERFDITITDEGQGFNPEEVPDPTAIENIERPCGRGLLLMRGFMSGVEYLGKGNIVRMWKLKDGPPIS